jgi:DNA-directed RNA polymerase subunit M/transcription elongation factor TFIIS
MLAKKELKEALPGGESTDRFQRLVTPLLPLMPVLLPLLIPPALFRARVAEQARPFFPRESHARNWERGLFNWTLSEAGRKHVVKKWDNPFFVLLYTDRLRSLLTNLRDPSLQAWIRTGSLRPHEIAFLSHQEMMPSRWLEALADKAVRDRCKCEQKQTAMTDTFTCRKCRSKECTYYQMQTRSADEPMTVFVTCLTCENRWRQSS